MRPDDLDPMLEYALDAETNRHMVWQPDRGRTEDWLSRAMEAALASPRLAFELVAVEREGGLLVGGVGLRVRSEEHRRADLGYVLRRDRWGRGYATEMASLMIRFGFADLHLHRISATCSPANLASARVLEKVGMRLEGRIRDEYWVRGQWRDSLIYGILEQELALPGAG